MGAGELSIIYYTKKGYQNRQEKKEQLNRHDTTVLSINIILTCYHLLLYLLSVEFTFNTVLIFMFLRNIGYGIQFYNLSKVVGCITILNSFFSMFASDPVVAFSLSLFLALPVVDNII